MKDYLKEIVDLTSDAQINPGWAGHSRNVNTIKSISIHHDASVRPHDYDSIARYRQEANYHTQTLGPGLQYHYKIDNVGQIFKTRPHETWLYVVGSNENTSTIAICLDGYFHPPHNQIPTREQYEALGQLLIKLCEQSPEFSATYPDVRPHRDFSSTACPGDRLAPWVFAIQSKADVLNIPAEAVYDWPEYQPQPAPIIPKPVDAVTSPTYDDLYRVYLNGKQIAAYKNVQGAYTKVYDNPGAIVTFKGQTITVPPKPEPIEEPDIPQPIPSGAPVSSPEPVTDVPAPNPTPTPSEAAGEAAGEGSKEVVRTALIGGVSYLISLGLNYLTGLPENETTVILTLVLKGIDKYIHENPNIKLKGISPL